MALSVVRWLGEQDGQQVFDARIGSHRYYAWGIGAGTRRQEQVPVLADRARTSPLLGPLDPAARGRVVLTVPTDAFTQDHHHLQLLSFRDEELRGPAASDPVDVPWRWTPPSTRTEELMTTTSPAARSARSLSAHTSALPAPRPPARPPALSQAQFLDALAGVIGKVLPFVREALPVVAQVGRLLTAPPAAGAATPTGGGAGGAAAGGAGGATAATPPLAQLLAQLLTEVQRVAGAPPAAGGAPAGAQATAGAAAGGTATPTAAVRASSTLRGPRDDGRYSRAAVAPLLTALPALMPLLQNVLTPQTVQSLISAADPNRLLQTTFAGVLDAARLGQQATDQLHAHLRALNPGLGDDVLVPLLASMSRSVDTRPGRAPAQRSGGRPSAVSRLVRLQLPDLAPVELCGYPQVAFRGGEEIVLPLHVDAPRPLRDARLRVRVRDAQTHDLVAERIWEPRTVHPGRLPEPVVLPAGLTSRLQNGREYAVCLELEWSGRGGTVGATTTQLVRIVGEALFDSLDSGGPALRLDDVELDRAWWHRVWAEPVDERRRLTARLVYEFRLLPDARENRRTRTSADLEQVSDRRAEGTLRAGLGVALPELSRLASRVGGEPLDEAALEALADPTFAAAFDRQASCSLSLHGRRGAQLAVWVWPEVKVHHALLRTPDRVSPTTGQVLAFGTRAVRVPVPALAHVVVTRSR